MGCRALQLNKLKCESSVEMKEYIGFRNAGRGNGANKRPGGYNITQGGINHGI